jgi:N-formylglutamate deformylase
MRIEAAMIVEGDSPCLATAIHDGHELRPEVAPLLALDEAARLREEDPFTGLWTTICENRVVGARSRFEVDLNRPRDQAIYLRPEDAWGLRVWKEPPPGDVVERSLALYDEFYQGMRTLLDGLAERHGKFVLLDLHTYNHRREGPEAAFAPASENPDVNVGTRSVTHPRWRPLIERFVSDLAEYDFLGRRLDVRENVKFGGGHFAQWVNGAYHDRGVDLAIEVKKFFMDEWTGEPDPLQLAAVEAALRHCTIGLCEELTKL